MSEILPDIVAEGRRLVERAGVEGVSVRLIGGVAVCLHMPNGIPAALGRGYADLDFVSPRGSSGRTQSFFRAAGYRPHLAFNALNARERLLFFDEEHARQLDVFVGAFRMCHAVPIADRLDLEPATIPLAELLLTKLQVVELTDKDVRDALALLHGHPVGEGDDETVNGDYVASLCSQDWGLWRTVTGNLALCRELLARYDLLQVERDELASKLEALAERIEREPKSRGWRLRARIGERRRWYELPDEVAGGP